MDQYKGKPLAGNFVVDLEAVGGAVHKPSKSFQKFQVFQTFHGSNGQSYKTVPVVLVLMDMKWNLRGTEQLERLKRLERLEPALFLAARALLLDLFFYLVEFHNVAVLVMHIE